MANQFVMFEFLCENIHMFENFKDILELKDDTEGLDMFNYIFHHSHLLYVNYLMGLKRNNKPFLNFDGRSHNGSTCLHGLLKNKKLSYVNN